MCIRTTDTVSESFLVMIGRFHAAITKSGGHDSSADFDVFVGVRRVFEAVVNFLIAFSEFCHI